MALNGDLLGTEILTQIDAAVASDPTASPAQRVAVWQAIGRAIVTHIQINGQVAVTSVGGVVPGGGVSGPGAGTIL